MKLDRIYDLVTRFFGQPNEKAAENLKEMAEKFFLCGGEFFLAVKRYPESFRRGLNFSGGLMPHCPDETYFLKTEIYLGIIRADEELEIRDGQEVAFRFPIQIPYAVGDILFGKSALWERADIFLMGSFFYDIMLYLKQEIETLEIDKPGLDIAIGDEEVKKLVRQYQNLINKHFGDFPLLQPIVEMSCLLARFLKNFPEQDEFLEKNPEILKKALEKGYPLPITEVVGEAVALENKIQEQQKRLSSLYEELKNRISEGETTGDQIQDFILGTCGRIDIHVNANLCRLQSDIDAKQGEFLLAIERWREKCGMEPNQQCQTMEALSLGVIEGELAVNGKIGELLFPFQKHVFLESWTDKPFLRIHKGEGKGSYFGAFHYASKYQGINLNRPLEEDEKRRPMLEIIAGDENVKKWLEEQTIPSKVFGDKNKWSGLFSKMCALLGKPL